MIQMVLMEGADLDEAQSIGPFECPVVPRVGEIITLPIEQRFQVIGINYHQVQLASKVEIFVHVKHLLREGGYDMEALLR